MKKSNRGLKIHPWADGTRFYIEAPVTRAILDDSELIQSIYKSLNEEADVYAEYHGGFAAFDHISQREARGLVILWGIYRYYQTQEARDTSIKQLEDAREQMNREGMNILPKLLGRVFGLPVVDDYSPPLDTQP